MSSKQKDRLRRTSGLRSPAFKMLVSLLETVRLEFSDRYNSMYGLEHFAAMLAMMCTRGVSAEEAASRFRDGPSSRWFLGKVRQIGEERMEKVMDSMLAATVSEAARIIGKRYVILCIDKHEIPCYSADRDHEYLVRSKEKKGTHTFYKYVTAQVVVGKISITIGCIRQPKSYNNAYFVRKFLDMCDKHGILVHTVLMDREFYSRDVMDTVDGTGTCYLIPAPQNGAVRREITRYIRGERGPFGRYEMNKTRNRPYAYTLVIDKIVHKRKGKQKTSYVTFATNMQIRGGTEDARKNSLMYKVRWSIETMYKMIETVRPLTTSRCMSVRLLLFYTALVVTNLWLIARADTKAGIKLITFVRILVMLLMEKAGIEPEPPPRPG